MMSHCELSDIPELKRLWKDIFNDTDSFIDWFFKKRFIPEMSYVCRENSKIICCMHTYPIRLNLGGKETSAVMVSGVSTLPDYRKKGYMRELFAFAEKNLQKKGVGMCFLTPANPVYYQGMGYVHITDYLKLENGVLENSVSDYRDLSLLSDSYLLEGCYNSFASRYSGAVIRAESFKIKMEEYICENLQCRAAVSGKKIIAYVIYLIKNNCIELAEAIGEPSDLAALISTFGKPIKGNLPPDFSAGIISGNADILPGAMGSITNIQKLLFEYGSSCPFIIKVTDTFIPENNGIYDFSGNVSLKAPDLELTSGQLLQALSGYKVPALLRGYFSERPCFTADLY